MKRSRQLAVLRLAVAGTVVTAAVAAPTLQASVITLWTNPLGGSFHDPDNWDFGVPGADDRPVFDLSTLGLGYTVTFSSDVDNQRLDVRDDTVTFDLNGHTYALIHPDVGLLRVGIVDGEVGELTLTGGGALSIARLARIGVADNAVGSLTVIGPDTTVSTDLGFFAANSPGALATITVSDGGAINVGAFFIAGRDFDNENLEPQAHGDIIVTGSGSLLSAGLDLFIAFDGEGTLLVANGGTVESLSLFRIGAVATSEGDVLVTGAGSSVTGFQVGVGGSGDGTMTVQDGAAVFSATEEISDNAASVVAARQGSTGLAIVTGPGSRWESEDWFSVGHGQPGPGTGPGTGTLIVSNGGAVASLGEVVGHSYIGLHPDGVGDAVVTGAGSTWTSNMQFFVGLTGQGTLTVENGGLVSSVLATFIGRFEGSSGEATVSGPGSIWTSGGTFTIGDEGQGILNVQDGGQVSAPQIVIGANGVVNGDGLLAGPVENGGEIHPGVNDPGTLTITGEYLQVAEGTLFIDLAAVGNDLLAISANATLAGTLVVTLATGFDPSAGETFDIFSAGAVIGVFDLVSLPAFDDDRFMSISYETGVVRLSVEALGGEVDFEEPQEEPAAGEPTAEASGDLDSDGNTDVVVVIPAPAGGALTSGSVQVFLNQGTDELGEWLGFVANDPIPVGLEPSSVAVGFFDADAHLDLAVTNAGDNTVVVLLNDGSGMGTFIVQAPITVGNRPSSVIAGDFNEDTFVDLAVANTFLTVAGKGGVADNSVRILFNDGAGNFMEGPLLDTGGTAPRALVAEDLDNDKCLDLIGVNKLGASIPLGNQGGGMLPPPVTDEIVITPTDPSTQSGIQGGQPGSVFVLLNQGGGIFAPAVTYDIGVNPRDVSTGDLDLDGFADIVAVNADDATVSILINQGGEFAGAFFPPADLLVGDQPRSIEAVDIDGDSDPDLAIVADDPVIGPAVQVLHNIGIEVGDVVFEEPIAFSVDADPNFVVSVDLDGDGLSDLVTVNSDIDDPSGGSVTGLVNSSTAFTASLDIKPGSCPNSFNRNSHGVLPVALVGRESFDVTQVDLDSLLLVRKDGVGGSVAPHEGPPGPSSEFEDVATPFEGVEQCDCHDLEGDGIQDLMMHFKTVDVVAALELNDLPDGDLVSLTLIGTLLDGTPFDADDCVRLVPPGTGDGLLAVGSNVPGAWLDMSPLDLQLDGGGFANFDRTFPQTTVVTLTAPRMYLGWRFVGWSVGPTGSTQDGLQPGQGGGLYSGSSIELTIQGHLQHIEAIYRPVILDTLEEH
ncbi:MAG: VCBS repeat-containing protein [Planctomycetes bacterium]|nr:VCBS repeat-containing protein [Planctomycetota bacterium]